MPTIDDLHLRSYLQFDQQPTDPTEPDYSRSRSLAQILGDGTQIEDGYLGRGYHLAPNTDLQVTATAVTLDADFTLSLWLRPLADPDTTVPAHPEPRRYNTFSLQTGHTPAPTFLVPHNGQYHHIAVVYTAAAHQITIFIDSAPVSTTTLPAHPTTLNIVAADPSQGTDIDTLQLFNTPATDLQVREIYNYRHPHIYTIDGVPFLDHHVYVEMSNGLLDVPKRKQTYTHSWAERHGQSIDLTTAYLEPRTITLDCFMPAPDRIHFTWQWNAFIQLFTTPGLHRLQLDIHPNHPLVYDIYLADQIALTKRWNDQLMVGKFKLKLTEPEPVKTVIRFRADLPNTQRTIQLTTSSLLNISWGDSQRTEDIGPLTATPTTHTLTHTYTATGIYYAIIYGDIDQITNLAHDGITIWQKI